MLLDQKEIDIMSKARQKNVRDPKRSRQHFENIFSDFKLPIEKQAWYLDMGAGQFDFGEVVRSKGGNVHGLDNDPAVIELATYKKFDASLQNLRKFSTFDTDKKFSGVFNKFSYNAFWFYSDLSAHEEFIRKLIEVSHDNAWQWIAPWNGAPKAQDLSQSQKNAALEQQKTLFEKHGFSTKYLTIKEAKNYGINGSVENNIIFYKNLLL